MEFKGTKGKWNADKNTTFGGKNSIIVSDEKGVIINLDAASFDSDEEMEANALLISKAPEMLEMLIEVLENKSDIDYKKVEQLIKEATEL